MNFNDLIFCIHPPKDYSPAFTSRTHFDNGYILWVRCGGSTYSSPVRGPGPDGEYHFLHKAKNLSSPDEYSSYEVAIEDASWYEGRWGGKPRWVTDDFFPELPYGVGVERGVGRVGFQSKDEINDLIPHILAAPQSGTYEAEVFFEAFEEAARVENCRQHGVDEDEDPAWVMMHK
jgi:hypothetical protein